MAKVEPEMILDVNQLPATTSSPQVEQLVPRELPPPLANFKKYVDSKCCYHAAPMNEAELVNVHGKTAYQCHMKILMESRMVTWTEKPAQWGTSTILSSSTLGRLVESTTRSGQPVGDIYNDYEVQLPPSDKKSKAQKSLAQCNYTSRCGECSGTGKITCDNYQCKGSGKMSCSTCGGTTIGPDGEKCVKCKYGTTRCNYCDGTGKVACSKCRGLGGFYHSATLHVKWCTRKTTWTYQNSFLPEKKIACGKQVIFWSKTRELWSAARSIEDFVYDIVEETPDIPLKANIIKDYKEKHLNPYMSSFDGVMRRLRCTIQRSNFEQIEYTLGMKYTNERHKELGNNFRFCQYLDEKGRKMIYENDYPMNFCGCLGEKWACYSCCCHIC